MLNYTSNCSNFALHRKIHAENEQEPKGGVSNQNAWQAYVALHGELKARPTIALVFFASWWPDCKATRGAGGWVGFR